MLNKQLKKMFMLSVTVLLVFAVIGGASGAELENSGRLKVTGTAVISGAPDVAYITLGVETRNQSAEEASQENAERMGKVMAALKELGLDDKAITTSGYNIYSYQQTVDRNAPEPQTITIYTVQNRINVTTTKLKEVGKIIDAAVKAGVNQVQGIRFDIKDKQEMQLLALQKATEQARLKAEAMAESAGVVIGGLALMEEEYASYAPMTDMVMMRAESFMEAETSISPGDVEVSARVWMEFYFNN